MDDLDRLFHRLVQNIRGEHPEYLARPFEIAELYQKLVPYRHHRRELQIDTNQDYEAAVTRLLAGERGYLVGDEGMQEFLRTELASPNPDTAVFREFGSNHVAIAPGALERLGSDGVRERRPDPGATMRVEQYPTPELDTRGAPSPPPEPPPPEPPPSDPPRARVATPVAAAPEPAAPPPPPVPQVAPPVSPPPTAESEDMAASKPISAGDVGGKCRYCAGALPDGRRIVFCPHCGQNLTVQRCPACSTELEMGWKFCVTCGRTVGAAIT